MLPMNRDEVMKGLAKMVATPIVTAGSDRPFLKLARHGVWCYGQEETEVQPGSRWALNPHSVQRGFIAWGQAEVLGERMASFNEPPIVSTDLPDVGGRWDPQLSCEMICLSGEDKGLIVRYSTTSRGGLTALTKLLTETVGRLQAGHQDFVPSFELAVDSYKHKKYGTVFTPELKVEKWYTLDDTLDTVADETEEAAPPPPPQTPPPRPRLRSRPAVT